MQDSDVTNHRQRTELMLKRTNDALKSQIAVSLISGLLIHAVWKITATKFFHFVVGVELEYDTNYYQQVKNISLSEYVIREA